MIPEYLRPYFWDIDIQSFNPQAHPEYTIERILELGDSKAVAWLQEQFSEEQIKNVICTNKRLTPKSANYWALVYQISHRDVTVLRYPLLFPLNTYKGIKVADPRDIAAMKLTAIASRSTKRDFIDLYILSKRYGLDEVIRLFENKFSQATFSDIHIKKSLTYFADADGDAMPHVLQSIIWDQVKQFFLTAVPRLKP